jgi:The GLUG motif
MKKLLALLSFVFVLTLAACGNDKPSSTTEDTTPDDTTTVPQLKSAVALSGATENGIKIIAEARDADAKIYYVVIDENAANPTAEQIKAGVNYSGVTVHTKGSGTGTIASTEVTEGLTGGTTYKIAFVAEKGSLFGSVVTKTAAATSADDLVDRGDGTAENPFWVETVEDLAKVGSTTDEWHPTAHYILKNDLDLGAAYNANGLSWTPLGNQNDLGGKFSGVFDGNGHTISNLYINHTTGVEKVGLFYELDVEGTIKNLNLKDVNITSNARRVGAVVGYAKGLIENVSVVGGTITSVEVTESRVGGVVGEMYEAGTITNVFTNVEILTSGKRAGGIVGHVDASDASTENLTISNAYALGNITGTTKEAHQLGGIVGWARNTDISNVYAAGNITGSEQIGGIAGYIQRRDTAVYDGNQPSVKNAFYIGSQLLASGLLDGTSEVGKIVGVVSTSKGTVATIENVYALESTILVGSGRTVDGESILELSNLIDTAWLAANLSGFDFTNTWEILTDSVRPVLQGLADDGLAIDHVVELVVYGDSAEAGSNAGELVVTINTNKAADIYYVIVAKDATAPTAEQVKAGVDYDGIVVLGAGSVLDAKTLSETKVLSNNTEYDVYYYAENDTETVEVSKKTGTSKELILDPIFGDKTNDEIEALGYYPIYTLSDLELFRDIANSNDANYPSLRDFKLMADIDMSSTNWTPIAEWNGTFDGQGFTINGLNINQTSKNVGFFSVVDPGGVIKNIKFTNVNIEGSQYVGTLIGEGKPTLVENVSVDGGTIVSTDELDSRIGGLIGRLRESDENSLIQKVWTNVDVSGSKNVGGIFGYVDYSTDTTITITVKDVYTLGDVTGTIQYTGGIAGFFRASLENAIAYGNVTGVKSVGGISGYIQNSAASTRETVETNRPLASIDSVLALNESVIGTSDDYKVANISSKPIVDYTKDKGEIASQTKLFALDSITTSKTESVITVIAADVINETWLETNTNFVLTGDDAIWQIVEGKIILK